MFKVGLIGPEASGKSTLAQYLAKRYQGVYIPEYGRSYVEEKGRREVSYDDLCCIAKHQIEEIKNLSDGLYFFDTELIVTKVWFEYAFGQIPQWLDEAIITYPMDVYLLTTPDLPWVQDGARYNGEESIRKALFERYEKEIQALDATYYIITHCQNNS